jgi:hypothetical protein
METLPSVLRELPRPLAHVDLLKLWRAVFYCESLHANYYVICIDLCRFL